MSKVEKERTKVSVVDDLKAKLYRATKEKHQRTEWRSLTAVTGIPLIGIKDIVSSVIDVKGVFDEQHWALAWVENGLGDALGIALTCARDKYGREHMTLAVGNRYSVRIRAGITVETLIRFALSEMKFSSKGIVSLTLFGDPELDLSPQLMFLDQFFKDWVIEERQRPWPLIFPRDHYVEKYIGRDLRQAWAMAREIQTVDGDMHLYGCNVFLQRYCVSPVSRRPLVEWYEP
jgi:hypothetical protein